MIYQTGTIATTAGQTKIKGTGTRWKDNLAGISEGCPISIFINNVVYFNNVLSVNSDTEINLTYPVPVAAAAAKYQIATFVLDSMSDGVRKMLANQQYIQYFLRNMDTWMTQDGIVEIKTPTGETVRLESIIALKKLIDGKLSTSGGKMTGKLDTTSLGIVSTNDNSINIYPPAGKDSDAFLQYRDGQDWFGKINIPRLPKNTDKIMMLVGDFGFGGVVSSRNLTDAQQEILFKDEPTSVWRNQTSNGSTMKYSYQYAPNLLVKAADTFFNMCVSHASGTVQITSGISGAVPANWKTSYLYGTANTTKDANGNLRPASPVIKVFADHIELNDESEGIELEKLGIGRYKLKGTLGMNSDASWGGIHGGLVVPNGINNLPLVWADFDVLPDGDIIIETRYRKHVLPQRLEAQRLMTYPEFLDENNIEREDYDYCDIPNGHWIDVRVNMPSDSIYNQKLAEAERLAKLEAERLAQEEAKRAAEEAEMAEQEAAEQVEQQ